MIWCSNHWNVHIQKICKSWSFIWGERNFSKRFEALLLQFKTSFLLSVFTFSLVPLNWYIYIYIYRCGLPRRQATSFHRLNVNRRWKNVVCLLCICVFSPWNINVNYWRHRIFLFIERFLLHLIFLLPYTF